MNCSTLALFLLFPPPWERDILLNNPGVHLTHDIITYFNDFFLISTHRTRLIIQRRLPLSPRCIDKTNKKISIIIKHTQWDTRGKYKCTLSWKIEQTATYTQRTPDAWSTRRIEQGAKS